MSSSKTVSRQTVVVVREVVQLLFFSFKKQKYKCLLKFLGHYRASTIIDFKIIQNYDVFGQFWKTRFLTPKTVSGQSVVSFREVSQLHFFFKKCNV